MIATLLLVEGDSEVLREVTDVSRKSTGRDKGR